MVRHLLAAELAKFRELSHDGAAAVPRRRAAQTHRRPARPLLLHKASALQRFHSINLYLSLRCAAENGNTWFPNDLFDFLWSFEQSLDTFNLSAFPFIT